MCFLKKEGNFYDSPNYIENYRPTVTSSLQVSFLSPHSRIASCFCLLKLEWLLLLAVLQLVLEEWNNTREQTKIKNLQRHVLNERTVFFKKDKSPLAGHFFACRFLRSFAVTNAFLKVKTLKCDCFNHKVGIFILLEN